MPWLLVSPGHQLPWYWLIAIWISLPSLAVNLINQGHLSCEEWYEIQIFNMFSLKKSGLWFNIKMLSYQYRKSHCGDKTVVRSSYLHNGISYTGKTTSLYWIRAQLHRVKKCLWIEMICNSLFHWLWLGLAWSPIYIANKYCWWITSCAILNTLLWIGRESYQPLYDLWS